jgi:hypothetical protein
MLATAPAPTYTPTETPIRPRVGPPGRFHAILDVAVPGGCPTTTEQVRTILEHLPPLIDMRILAGPHVVEGMPYNPGITGFAIIDFSHISVHTFSDCDYVMVDIFSCKAYDIEVVRRFLGGMFDLPPASLNLRVVSWE